MVEGSLNGTLSEKRKQYAERFAHPATHLKKYYQDWTYLDLKILTEKLRSVAENEYGFKGIRIGSFVLAWKSIYGGSPSNWSQKHPGVYSQVDNFVVMDNFNPTATLSDDTTHYGAFPHGVKKGMHSYDFFAAQWGDLSKATGLDALVLRDGVIGPGVYTKKGPFGPKASPDPQKNKAWAEAAAAMVKAVKLANPASLVIGYSSAFSPVADWRVNCFDLEDIAGQGYLDAYIDQTWAGAWNEAGIREWEYWNRPLAGWTYQMAYMLLHAAILANSKVHHYQLTETFDAWESWDVIHTVPERLKWGIWAYSHAAVKTPNGLKMPAGAYVSWCNQGMRLLPEADVNMLSHTLNEAYRDAAQVTDVFGPTVVYNRNAMEWQQNNDPAGTIKEWIDEYAGTLMKWSLPVFSVTRLEYLSSIKTDLPILQTPVHLGDAESRHIETWIKAGKPLAIVGSPAGGIDPQIAALAGFSSDDGKPGAFTEYASLPGKNAAVFPITQLFSRNVLKNGAKPVYQVLNDLPATAKTELRLVLESNEKKNEFDYGDWVNAKLIPSDRSQPAVPLTALKPLAFVQNWAVPQINKSVACGPLRIAGQTYQQGIGAHAISELVYALPPGKYSGFESEVGVDDQSDGKGRLKFRIYANDSLLYESDAASNVPAKTVSVNIPKAARADREIVASPALVVNNSSGRKLLCWDPPVINTEPQFPLINLIGGSAIPYLMVDSILMSWLQNSSSPFAGRFSHDQPISIGAWQLSDGSYSILAGQLEEGLQFCEDRIPPLSLTLPQSWNLGKNSRVYDIWKDKTLKPAGNRLTIGLGRADCTVIAINPNH